jgi:hypothetical protein
VFKFLLSLFWFFVLLDTSRIILLTKLIFIHFAKYKVRKNKDPEYKPKIFWKKGSNYTFKDLSVS